MHSVDTETFSKSTPLNRRRPHRRWIPLVCVSTLFVFYFCYYAYYYHVSLPHTTKQLMNDTSSIPANTWSQDQPRGALYMIVRNENLPQARAAIRNVQDRFNHLANYPWVLLNDQEFNPDFIMHTRAVLDRSNTSLFFGKIDADVWSYPSWIDVPRSENAVADLARVNKGASLSHHHMLRKVAA